MKFSIIIPVYNAAGTISRCIDSILANNYLDYEILLIDDCSKDNSLDICMQYAMKHQNISVFHNEINRGVSFTRNVGLDHAQGKFLLFADSDDWIESSYLDAFDKAVRLNKLFSVCGFYNHDEKYNGRLDIYKWNSQYDFQSVKLYDHLEDMYSRTLLQQLWNKAFLSEIVQEHQLRFDESISIGEDLRFILSYLKAANCEEMTIISTPLYHYMRDQEGSLMFRVGYEGIEEPLKNKRMLYELMGLTRSEIENRITDDKEKLQKLYAYLIMHNSGMSIFEKKRLTINLDKKEGTRLFWSNYILYWKEKISRLIKH